MKKILKFGAPWCGPCKFQDKILNELIEQYKVDVDFVNVDETEGEALAEVYKVYNVPSIIIVDGEGDEITRFTGLTQLKTLKEALGL